MFEQIKTEIQIAAVDLFKMATSENAIELYRKAIVILLLCAVFIGAVVYYSAKLLLEACKVMGPIVWAIFQDFVWPYVRQKAIAIYSAIVNRVDCEWQNAVAIVTHAWY